MISLIAAMDKNRVIGRNNTLPWHMPADLKRFREITRGKSVIMGSRTFESIGKPLPDRLNIVMTRDRSYRAAGCAVVHSVEEALHAAGGGDEIMVIGGAAIFKEFLPRARRMYLTLIDHVFEGDTYFPEYDKKEWLEVRREEYSPDNKNKYHSTFLVLERI